MKISPSLNPSPQGREIFNPSPLGGECWVRGILELLTIQLEAIFKKTFLLPCFFSSFPCKRESRVFKLFWMPAFADMTAFSEESFLRWLLPNGISVMDVCDRR